MHINQTMEREHLQPRFCEQGKHQPIYCGQLWTIWYFLALFRKAKIFLIGDFPAFIDRTILPSNLDF